MRTARAWLLLASAVAVSAVPAGADWLVLRDGSRLETEGAWTVHEKRITFTLKQGGLSSLRGAEVDLEASASATRAAREKSETPAPPPRPGKRAPVLVLTDSDVRHVGDAADAAPVATPTGEAVPAGQAQAKTVVVAGWDRALSDGGWASEVTGTLRNTGKNLAAGLTVRVRVFDEKGVLVATEDATLSTSSIPPGGVADFSAVFPGVRTIFGVKFDVDYRDVLTGSTEVTPQA